LSNWYVRRSRRRFWKSEAGTDKLAAYQTLYTVLTTFIKLIAPVVPFLAEAMFQNLRHEQDPDSVHLCDYPQVDPALVDARMSAQVEAELRIVSLGMAARQVAKSMVRQPLAEVRVHTASQIELAGTVRFAEEIQEELNVKRLVVSGKPLLRLIVKANMKSLGRKAGAHLQAVKAKIESGDAELLPLIDGTVNAVSLVIDGHEITVTPDDLAMTPESLLEGWVGVVDRGTQVSIDTRITEELAQEGLARNIVRLIQESRKEADLNLVDRIELQLASPSVNVRNAIEAHRETIMNETLATSLQCGETTTTSATTFSREGKVEGVMLTVTLQKVE